MPRLEAVHPVLMARDVSTSVAFYKQLGFLVNFEDSPTSPKYVVISRDGIQLHLQWADHDQWPYPNDRPVYRFLVNDVDGLYEEFRSADVLIERALGDGPWRIPGDTPWGTREFHIRDPGGNGLQFYRTR